MLRFMQGKCRRCCKLCLKQELLHGLKIVTRCVTTKAGILTRQLSLLVAAHLVSYSSNIAI